MRFLLSALILLTCFGDISAAHKKNTKKTVKRKHRRRRKPQTMHHKVVHTESFEEDIERNMPVKKKKKSRARKILVKIFSLGLSVLFKACR